MNSLIVNDIDTTNKREKISAGLYHVIFKSKAEGTDYIVHTSRYVEKVSNGVWAISTKRTGDKADQPKVSSLKLAVTHVESLHSAKAVKKLKKYNAAIDTPAPAPAPATPAPATDTLKQVTSADLSLLSTIQKDTQARVEYYSDFKTRKQYFEMKVLQHLIKIVHQRASRLGDQLKAGLISVGDYDQRLKAACNDLLMLSQVIPNRQNNLTALRMLLRTIVNPMYTHRTSIREINLILLELRHLATQRNARNEPHGNIIKMVKMGEEVKQLLNKNLKALHQA